MSKLYSFALIAAISSIIFISCSKTTNVVVPVNKGTITGMLSNTGSSFSVSDENVYLTRTYSTDSVPVLIYHLNAIISRYPDKVLTLTLKGPLTAQTYGIGTKKVQALYQIGSAPTDIYTTTSDSSVISGSVNLTTYSIDSLIGNYSVTVTNPLGNKININGGSFNCSFVR